MSASPRLVVVADGGPELGLGHLSRCLALVQYVDGRYPTEWLTRTPNDWLSTQLSACRISPTTVTAETWSTQLRPGDLVVMDGYAFTRDDERQVLACGGRLIRLDDFAAGPAYLADLVVNTAPEVGADAYAPRMLYTDLALGTGYALLRPPFDSGAGTAGELPQGQRSGIVIALGGADAPNHTARVAEALAELGQPLTLVIGAANRHAEALAALSLSVPVAVQQNMTAAELADAFARCAVAVTSASVTAQEAAALGTPLVVIETATNQALLARGMTGRHLALGAGGEEYISTAREQVRLLLESVAARELQHRAQRRAYAGGYAQRWQQRLAALASQGLWLRRTTAADAQALHDWANDPQTRANSYHSAPIALAEHLSWLERRLADPHTTLWIVIAGTEAVGQIRLQRAPDQRQSVLSIGLAPAARGRGLAAPALARAAQAYGAHHPGEPIHATIKVGNTASRRAFERAGFAFEPDILVEGHLSHHCIFVP